MIAFIEKLNSEVLRSIERIESRDTDVLKKSLEASRVLGEAFDRLKQYIIGYRFQNDDEEIKFFKEIKPRLFCRLIYYRKLYNIEMNRPVGSIEAQREYLDAHVRAINAYTQKRLDFIRYFRSGAIRNNPTPWLDKAKEALLKRMQTWKRNKKNGNSE